MNKLEYTSFLYVVPKNKPMFEVNDEITQGMQEIFNAHKNSTGVMYGDVWRFDVSYRGHHTCICGRQSTNSDFLILNKYITNSLCVHYLRDHRDECSEKDLNIVKTIIEEWKKI